MDRMRSIRALCIAGIILLLTLGYSTLARAQNRGKLPDELRPSLNARLAQFTQAQADGRWEDVASMLGRYRMGGTGHHPLTPESKVCLVTQMKEIPMVAFTMRTYTSSTEIWSLPLGRRFWTLVGEAVFRPATGEQKSQSQITAYRDKGDWFFSPPNYDRYWEKTHFTEADFAVDRADEIEIEDAPTSPLEITDVHAFIDKKHLSLLNVSFKLKNRTNKKVSGFSVGFYVKGGSVTYSAPHAIDSGAFVEEKEQYVSRYVYFCDGVAKHKFRVDQVDFAGGTEWNRPKQR